AAPSVCRSATPGTACGTGTTPSSSRRGAPHRQGLPLAPGTPRRDQGEPGHHRDGDRGHHLRFVRSARGRRSGWRASSLSVFLRTRSGDLGEKLCRARPPSTSWRRVPDGAGGVSGFSERCFARLRRRVGVPAGMEGDSGEVVAARENSTTRGGTEDEGLTERSSSGTLTVRSRPYRLRGGRVRPDRHGGYSALRHG